MSWSQVLDHADSSVSYEKLILDSKYAEPNWEDIFAEETNQCKSRMQKWLKQGIKNFIKK